MPDQPLALPPAQYVNTLTVRSSAREFYLDFGQIAGSAAGPNQFAHLIATLVTSPAHVKEIVELLQRVVNQYEEMHGKIQDPKAKDMTIQ